jgi:DNA invertase Pin-like site-specific DNA recombinase
VQAHTEQLKALCDRYGYIINDAHIYVEFQQDNEEYNRPELQRFLASVKSGLIDIVVLKNVQDFSKRPSHLITILNVLENAGVWVETLE